MRKLITLLVAMAMAIGGTAAAVASSDDQVVETTVAGSLDHYRWGPREVTEEVITFENEGGTIYATLTLPARRPIGLPTVLMLHGFTGSRQELPIIEADGSSDPNDTMFSRTALMLAEEGMAVFRIDFRGSGESIDEMTFAETTFSGQISDAMAAVDWLERDRRFGDIGILGLSQGGLVGSVTAETNNAVDSLVLWSPVANPVDTYKTVLGEENVLAGLTQETTHIVLPWLAEIDLNRPFFEELYTTDPIAAISHYDGPLQVVVGSKDTIVTPQPRYGELYTTYHEGHEELVVVNGDHVFDILAGNGAPALMEAIDEGIDHFEDTLRQRRW
jgi:pimeloyl-ACP methyl ester carboxylesterase